MAYGNSIQQALYYRGPGWLRDAITTVYGLREHRRRYGADFRRHLALLEESQHWPPDRMRAWVVERLWSFLADAIPHTPYYRENAAYRDALAARDFSRLPLLTKGTVRAHPAAFHRDDWRTQPHKIFRTSGTSGGALAFPVNRDCFQREYAFRELHYRWGGVSLVGPSRFAFCAGHPVADPGQTRPPFWAEDRAHHHLYLSSYHLTETNLPHYLDRLAAHRPDVIAGYPSSAFLLALAALRSGDTRIRPRAVYSFSETLHERQRAVIAEAFAAPVFNWYGNSEQCANIVSCAHGSLHLKQEHSLVEVLDEANRPVGPGGTGRLVCTGFGNPLFPLIRYDVGDRVTLADTDTCPCGANGPLVAAVEGRVEDYIFTPDGRAVGRLDHLFKDAHGVSEAQLIQEQRDTLIIRYVASPAADRAALEAIITAEARTRLGPSMRLAFDPVPAIPRGRTGKQPFIINRLPPDQRQRLLRLNLDTRPHDV